MREKEREKERERGRGIEGKGEGVEEGEGEHVCSMKSVQMYMIYSVCDSTVIVLTVRRSFSSCKRLSSCVFSVSLALTAPTAD